MMIETHHDMPEETREKVVDLLNARLADTIDLRYQAKQAHWNVKGIQFRSLHKLFDQLAELTEEPIDQFAERAVQLGGVAEGTLQAAAENTSLEEYPRHVLDGAEHLTLLRARLSRYCAELRRAIELCDDWGDAVTSDMITGMLGEFDETFWMIEAHLFQGESAQATGAEPTPINQAESHPRFAARKAV